jgi:hypothetical protein
MRKGQRPGVHMRLIRTKYGVRRRIINPDVVRKEFIKGGMSSGMPPSTFNPTQMRMGVKVEKEHTTNPKIAAEIARDHLAEFPRYYTHLKVMERRMAAQK